MSSSVWNQSGSNLHSATDEKDFDGTNNYYRTESISDVKAGKE